MSDSTVTKIEEAAKVAFDTMIERARLGGTRTVIAAWEGEAEELRQDWRECIRAILLVLRRPSMSAVMRASGQIAMRPSDVDLAVTHYLDAILQEAK